MDFSDELIQEQAYLVSRGVRPLALLGSINPDPATMKRALVRLNQLTGASAGSAIPFVLLRADMGCAMVGFAAAQWVVDLLEWSYRQAPMRQHHCIIGLLLGYSASAIAEHDAREYAGLPTVLCDSSSPRGCSTNTG